MMGFGALGPIWGPILGSWDPFGEARWSLLGPFGLTISPVDYLILSTNCMDFLGEQDSDGLVPSFAVLPPRDELMGSFYGPCVAWPGLARSLGPLALGPLGL